MTRIKTTFIARIYSPDGYVHSTVNFDDKHEAIAYTHDALRFERFGRGCRGEVNRQFELTPIGR